MEEEEEEEVMEETLITTLVESRGMLRFSLCYKVHISISFAAFSFTCGGVGHLSRDCVQGAKCYNCSGLVCTFLCSCTSSVLTRPL